MNGIIEAIIKLWGECHNPIYIAQKLELIDEAGDYDTDLVERVIDNPENYPSCSTTTQGAR